jgi:hypothetical protein
MHSRHCGSELLKEYHNPVQYVPQVLTQKFTDVPAEPTGFIFCPEDGGNIILWNVSAFQSVTYLRTVLFVTAVRTPNLSRCRVSILAPADHNTFVYKVIINLVEYSIVIQALSLLPDALSAIHWSVLVRTKGSKKTCMCNFQQSHSSRSASHYHQRLHTWFR